MKVKSLMKSMIHYLSTPDLCGRLLQMNIGNKHFSLQNCEKAVVKMFYDNQIRSLANFSLTANVWKIYVLYGTHSIGHPV